MLHLVLGLALSLVTASRSSAGDDRPGAEKPPTPPARHQLYAPPLAWGNWATVGSHIGPASYTIEVQPIGDTVVVGEVRYYSASGKQMVESFHGEITIRTGNSIANVEVRLKGVPTGSSCWVDVTP